MAEQITKDKFCIMIGCTTAVNMAYRVLSFLSDVVSISVTTHGPRFLGLATTDSVWSVQSEFSLG